MSQFIHTLSSSDDSNDSLPDLQSRILSKLPKQKSPASITVHTISSSDDDNNEDCSTSKESFPATALIGIKSEMNAKQENDDLEILSEVAGSSSGDPFDEALPDIPNFTILSGGLDIDKKIEQVDTPPKFAAKKLRAAEIRDEKEAKRREREALRQKRALEKAETKAQKEAERTARRAMKPGECMKYVKVQLDRHLLELPEGSRVISHLQLAEVRYEVIDSAVPYVATVMRIDPLSLQEKLAEDSVILIPTKDFVALVERQIYYNGNGGLCEKCEQWKSLIGTPRLTIILPGIQTYLRGKKTNKQQDFRAAILGEDAQPKKKKKKTNPHTIDSRVNRIDIETALAMAQLDCGVNHRLMSDTDKVGAFIAQATKSIAEMPYKLEKEDFTFSWYAEGSSSKSVKVDKSGVGLAKLWRQQLEQFSLVGPEVSQAIAREYPSPQALIQAYRYTSSPKEASLLLAEIPVRRGTGPLVSTRRVGPELSKKIHLFFTCTDPDVNLGLKS